MKEVTFRTARAGELEAIVSLISDDDLGRQREASNAAVAREYHQAFDVLMSDDNHVMAVAELHGEIVGYMQITYIPGLSRKGAWRGQLESIRVAAHLRGKGVGRAFLQWAIEQCRSRGCRLVQLTSDRRRSEALRLYERLGFVASHNGLKLEI